MPIYEYRCSACGHEDEFLQKVSDAPLTECPKCKQSAFVKKISAAGFQLKGSGWYVTDFRGGGSKPATKDGGSSETKADGGGASATTTASDSKPSEKAASSSGSSGDSGGTSSGPKDTTATASGT